jgi:PAS domain S-box-containing protein
MTVREPVDDSVELAQAPALDDREIALSQQRALLEGLFDAIPDCVFLKDTEGRYRLANQAACAYFGLPVAAVIGRTDAELVDAATASLFRAQDHAAVMAGAPRRNEEWLVYKDGTRVLAETTKTTVVDAKGAIVGVLGVARDITARKRAEDALAAYKADLEQIVEQRSAELRKSRDDLALTNLELQKALRAKDEFLATMSHELRTPLSSILMISEALQEGVYGDIGERQREALSTLDGSGRRLGQLIADVLDLVKIGASKLTVETRVCDARELGQVALERIASSAAKKDIAVASTFDAEPNRVSADPRRLEQMLVNLLDNAVKFTPRGGHVGLDIGREPGGRVVRFTVWDTGPGIAVEDQAKLFEPFTQLDSRLARGHAGTGLGLALTRALAELHGGSLAVESHAGSGSRFVVSIPWVEEP